MLETRGKCHLVAAPLLCGWLPPFCVAGCPPFVWLAAPLLCGCPPFVWLAAPLLCGWLPPFCVAGCPPFVWLTAPLLCGWLPPFCVAGHVLLHEYCLTIILTHKPYNKKHCKIYVLKLWGFYILGFWEFSFKEY